MKKITSIVLLIMFASCTKTPNTGNGFIGNWENPEKPYGLMTIEYKNENPDNQNPYFRVKTQDGATHEGQLGRKGILNLWYTDGQYNLALDREGNIKMIKDPNPSNVNDNLSIHEINDNGKLAKRIEN